MEILLLIFCLLNVINRNNLNITLLDENCYCNMYGIYALNDDSHVDNHTSVDHIQKNSISNEHYKGIMNGNSNGVFNGKFRFCDELVELV